MNAQWFPVLHGITIREVPWDFIAPHEAQAVKNHDQPLVELARRGGLDAVELLAIVKGRGPIFGYGRNDLNNAEILLSEEVRAFEEAHPCAHVWIANTGRGGPPDFRMNRMMSAVPLMHVLCDKCGCRTWFDEARWNALPRAEATQ